MNSVHLPVLDDNIINQTMSSSPMNIPIDAPMTSTRLKRRKTMDPSSLTSAISPLGRVKRAKNSKDIDDLTQVTTPGKHGHTQGQEADIWEFTGSSDPKVEPLKTSRLGKTKKTYGKLKRSKTSIGYSQSSRSETQSPQKAAIGDDHTITASKGSSGQSVEELAALVLPKEKKTYGKVKRSKTVDHHDSKEPDPQNQELLALSSNAVPAEALSSPNEEPVRLAVPKEKKTYAKLKRSKTLMSMASSQSEVLGHEKSLSKDDSYGFDRKRRASHSQEISEGLPVPQTKRQKRSLYASGRDLVEINESLNSANDPIIDGRSSLDVAKIQVPRSAGDEDAENAKLVLSSFADGNNMITSPRLKTPHEQQTLSEVSYDKSRSSISVIPATLTESQKMTYETISIASTNQERRSSIAEIAVDAEDGGASADLQNTPPITEPGWGAAEEPTKSLTSSPPVLAAKRKMKRAKSSSGVDTSLDKSLATALPTTSRNTKAATKKKRRKTTADIHPSQISIDELSYTKSQELEKSTTGGEATKEPRKKVAKESLVERMSVEELLNSDEIGIPSEKYQPRLSRRRSKSMGIDPLAEDASNFLISLPPTTRRKTSKAAKGAQETANGDALPMQSNMIPGTTESTELMRDNHRGRVNTRHVAETIDFTGSVVETPQTGSINVFGSLADDTVIPNTDYLADTPETDTVMVLNTIETPVITVPPAATKRRGRPPNVPVTTPTVSKAAVVVTEEAPLLDGSLDFTETLIGPTAKVTAPVKRRGRPPKSTEKVLEDAEEVDILPEKEACAKGNHKNSKNALQKRNVEEQRGNQMVEPNGNKAADFLLPKSTPPQATETSEALPLVTPTKNIKKGPDHSPIPQSKVALRVGLSKKTKIAPLLKMIKK